MMRYSVAAACLLALLAAALVAPSLNARTDVVQKQLGASYLPLVFKPVPPTPAPAPVPTPDGPCAHNAPPPADGAQAWMTNHAPQPSTTNTLCARLVVRGVPVHLASVSATVHYKTSDRALGPVSTRDNGVAALSFTIGRATSGYPVRVDVLIDLDGTMYTTQTSFTPAL